jgi:MerR family transcriptional regulator, thiopeptide resistance regulator
MAHEARTRAREPAESAYTVGEFAEVARVSIRTLHHYDAIGLLSPSRRTGSGYRLYGRDELEQLHQILVYRELDFPLDAIARIMLDPTFDRRAALVAQREQLAARVGRMEAILAAIDAAIEALAKGEPMDDTAMFEVFGDFDPKQYEAEVKERWGETDAYKESARRTARYTKEDWKQIKSEGDAVTRELAERLAAGAAPADADVQALVERHRLQIDRWFYPCPVEMQVNLGEMYVADPRFTATYDRYQPGLARFLRDAIRVRAGLPAATD